MRPSIKALLSCLMALVIATTGFATSVFASPLPMSLSSGESTQVAFIASPTATKSGKALRRVSAKSGGRLAQKYGAKKLDNVIIRVAPKVAYKLLKKYGPVLITVFPGVGTAIKVVEVSVDIYNEIQQELAQDSQFVA